MNSADLLTNGVINYIDQNHNAPFFIYLAHFAMHAPVISKPTEFEYFFKKSQQLSKLLPNEEYIDDPYSCAPLKRRQDSPDYAGELATLDENIGKIVQYLKDKGLYDNTIIIITGDNGGRVSYRANPTSIYPMRGGKTFTFDGGLRTPLLIHNPQYNTRNMHSDQMVTSMDLYPTILDMVGVSLNNEQHKDGVSLLPIFKHKRLSKRNLYFHFPHYQGEGGYPTSAICRDDYKLIINYHQKDILMFNLKNDPYETTNIVDKHPKIANKMKCDLINYLSSVGAHIPQENKCNHSAPTTQQ